MGTTGVLSLGPNRVANTWADGCKGLGIAVLPPFINKEAPTLDELLAFFRTSPDWIYFAGHHLGNELYSERMSVRLAFEKDKISLMTGGLPTAKDVPTIRKKPLLKKILASSSWVSAQTWLSFGVVVRCVRNTTLNC